jgi:hypothetical protein
MKTKISSKIAWWQGFNVALYLSLSHILIGPFSMPSLSASLSHILSAAVAQMDNSLVEDFFF